jgi:hypothetical protein
MSAPAIGVITFLLAVTTVNPAGAKTAHRLVSERRLGD